MKLRPLQELARDGVVDAWNSGATNVLLTYGCGGGKTLICSDIIKKHDEPSCAIAHRQELVSQMAITLARNEIKHRIIGPKNVVKRVVQHQMIELGKSYYDPSAKVGVAGVDTLVKNHEQYHQWFKSVTLWVQDEGHHLLKNNKWGKGVALFPNAKGLAVTATGERADNKGLGRNADGLIDVLVKGATERELINTGNLTDYKVFNPGVDFDRTIIPSSDTTGDFTQVGAANAVKNSPIIGDLVTHYLRIAPGKLNVVFVPSVEIAINTARHFNNAGIPAAVIHAKTPLLERISLEYKFASRELLVLVNVDLFGEGYDLPALEVVQMARPTKSYPLFHQQFMRVLRLMISKNLSTRWGSFTDQQRLDYIAKSEKPYAIIIDHVNNIDTEKGGHGLPDAPREWSLERYCRRSKKKDKDVIPTRTCIGCSQVYRRVHKICPYCGVKYIPLSRSSPEFVDGDLTELDAKTLAKMRGEVERVDMKPEEYKKELEDKRVPLIGQLANVKRHVLRQEMQKALRASISWWGVYHRSKGVTDDESDRRFYFMFNIDVLSAKALKLKESKTLAEQINVELGKLWENYKYTL